MSEPAPRAVVQGYAGEVRNLLRRFLSPAVVLAPVRTRVDGEFALVFLGEASPLVGPSLRLSLEHRFVVTTGVSIVRGYEYALLNTDYQELLAYHWHPRTLSWPHLHIRTRLTGQPHALTEAHLPTGQLDWPAVASLLGELTTGP